MRKMWSYVAKRWLVILFAVAALCFTGCSESACEAHIYNTNIGQELFLP